jgi:hypothetical protein
MELDGRLVLWHEIWSTLLTKAVAAVERGDLKEDAAADLEAAACGFAT